MPRFEVYLQFDSFEREPLMTLRGADLRESRMKAIEKLNELGISTTLVVTLKRGSERRRGRQDHRLGRPTALHPAA